MKDRFFRQSWGALCAVVLVSGCVSPAVQQDRQAQKREQAERKRQEALEMIRDRCEEYGFQPGTDGFAGCVQKEAQSHESAAQSNAKRKSDVALCKSAMYARPTRTGSFAESAANAAKCDSDPQAHLHEEQKPASYTCKENIHGGVNCDPR